MIVGACAVCCGSLAGCTAEVLEEEDLAQSLEPITNLSNEYTWNQGTLDVYMGDWTEWTCFLNGMKGNFQGWGESIYAIPLSNPFGSNWFLTGSSYQTGVGTFSRCIRYSAASLGQFYSWNQGDAPVDMGTGSKICAITRISGKFASQNERIEITRSTNGRWTLYGASTTQDVSAQAVCFAGPTAGTEYVWNSTQGAPTPMAANPLPNSRNFCWLTHISGNFDSPNDIVRVQYDVNASLWSLNGGGSGAKSAKARCSQT
jgi:hypothetical protein